MGQAQQEMMNQGQLAQTFGGLGAQQQQLGQSQYQLGFMPLQQQLNAMQVAQNSANMAQTGQLTGTGYGAQLGLGGIQTAVNADKAASELYGEILSSMLRDAGSSEEGESWLGGLFGDGGLFDF